MEDLFVLVDYDDHPIRIYNVEELDLSFAYSCR